MDAATVRRKRRQLTIGFAAIGFVITAVIWAYSELTDSSSPRPLNFPLWTAFVILCPPSLLSAPLIDVEPGSTGFTTLWLVIGFVNSVLYAVIGMVVGRFRWKPDNQTALPN